MFTPDYICTTPGSPGPDSPCATCVAQCSDDPADPVSDAEVSYWLHAYGEGGHIASRLLGVPGEPTAKGWMP